MLYHSAQKGSRLATLRYAVARQVRYTPNWKVQSLHLVGSVPQDNMPYLPMCRLAKIYDQLCKTPQ
ncbi:hypothetical protein [Vibrio phage vB_VhaP_PG11]|nr:hypothetical protein [Vibrio phage vB_VhaP_PG11]